MTRSKGINILKFAMMLCATIVSFNIGSLFSEAAVCRDVQDYGYHRYSQMHYEPTNTNYVFLGIDSNGNFVYTYDVYQRQVCICGAERNQYLGTYRMTVPHY